MSTRRAFITLLGGADLRMGAPRGPRIESLHERNVASGNEGGN